MLAWASAGGKAGIWPLEIDFLLRNTLISLYKLHFCIILPLPEVLLSPHRNWSWDAHVSWLHDQRQLSLKQHDQFLQFQHAIKALEGMKEEDEYSTYVANKPQMKDSNAVCIYI